MRGRRGVAWIATACLLVASVAAADPARSRRRRGHALAEADQLRSRGMAHHLEGEYRLAAQELMAAFRLDGRDDTLYRWAEAARASEDCVLATRLYERLAQRSTDLELIEKATNGLAQCGPSDEPDEAAEVDDDVDVQVEVAPLQLDPPAVVERPRARPDTWVVVLGGGGALVTTAGLAMYLTAGPGDLDGRNHGEVTAAESHADWQRVIGTGVATLGVGLTVAAVLRHRAVRDRERPPRWTAYVPAGATAGFGVSGRF